MVVLLSLLLPALLCRFSGTAVVLVVEVVCRSCFVVVVVVVVVLAPGLTGFQQG